LIAIVVLGFVIVLTAAVFFCFQNVIVRVLFTPQILLGLWPTGGFVPPTLYHSLLLLFLRMAVAVPLMAVLAQALYAPTWQEIHALHLKERRFLLLQSLTCGLLMFLYLVLLYIAVGLIPTGIALTLFFSYPVFTALLAWYLFGDRPTALRWSVMGLVLVGSALTLPQRDAVTTNLGWGVAMGIASGLAYAGYTVMAQKSVAHLHPVPFTWISFLTTLVLSALCLSLWPHPETAFPWLPLWIGGFCSALVTFMGHLLHNYGIRLIGASQAAIIGATNPALTAVLAWFTIQERLTILQVSGILLVTLSVALLSRRMEPQALMD
jgi:drug/metabolite transporter (DMT)-like permease